MPYVRDNICPVPEYVTPVTNGVDTPPEVSVSFWADPDLRNPVVTDLAGR